MVKKKEHTIEELRQQIEIDSLPVHVAIIMDGNGRWAVRRGMPRVYGHKKGADVVRKIVEIGRKLGISVLTLYAFSDENWGRPKQEVGFLMDMLGNFLKAEIETMTANDIRFRTIGRTDKLPPAVQKWIVKAATDTAANTGMVLNLALSYGGRGEIIDAIKRMQESNGTLGNLTEEAVSLHLDTAGLPDPDLIIRTSGEQRISNFLLWQAAYAELYFTETLWPDFNERELLLALIDYQGRQRRFGLTGAQAGHTKSRRPAQTKQAAPAAGFRK